MAVMAREAWTDERLDDLNPKVDTGFAEVRGELKAQRRELREEIACLRKETREDNALVHQELGDIHRAIHQFAFAMVGTVFLGFCGTIAALISLT
jgi:uncharacterized coiled-coil DUF342 family protein